MTKKSGLGLYLILISIFIAALVGCNLIFQKFFIWESPLGLSFELSVGILPYPITFLVTDIISEFYGKKWANKAVVAGLIASVFMLIVVTIAGAVPATSWSPVGDEQFNSVFGFSGVAVAASMLAYLLAQFLDVKMFHFWKRKTKGKHLWIRNNFSTIGSQAVDTAAVLLLLCTFGVIDWGLFVALFLNGFLFKVLFAAIDTPLFYGIHYWIRKAYNLKLNETFVLD
ncbi:MAG: putative integral membrane protein (TIGR00697 family) [Sphingobacteriales bacterium]|jgi:uncharacterized integral membrane protein (TIGR00697 family)